MKETEKLKLEACQKLLEEAKANEDEQTQQYEMYTTKLL